MKIKARKARGRFLCFTAIQKSGIVDHGFALGIIGDFEEFMNKENNDVCLENIDRNKRLLDEELIKVIGEKYKIKATMIQREPREKKKRILRGILEIDGVSTRQLSRVTGISVNIIWSL